jgi:predicted ABC-type sugar transport system permease subunit
MKKAHLLRSLQLHGLDDEPVGTLGWVPLLVVVVVVVVVHVHLVLMWVIRVQRYGVCAATRFLCASLLGLEVRLKLLRGDA